MDFFGAQDKAKKLTRMLIAALITSLLATASTVYFAVILLFSSSTKNENNSVTVDFDLWQPDLFILILCIFTIIILAGSTYRTFQLARGGGEDLAESVGGEKIFRDTDTFYEKRLINIVDEMAIASGIKAPPVFVLYHEKTINAFAAGTSLNTAVVAVTQGALEYLSRDELQGVIAHEFSHILNGDMRINIRLTGILYGLMMLTILGRIMVRGGRNHVVFMGLVLIVLGAISQFCAKLIKAAISRQREYLADASAVQFTRNPDGIASALNRIRTIGSTVSNPRAEEVSHMFFGNAMGFSSLTATHPPLSERILRINSACLTDDIAPLKPNNSDLSTEHRRQTDDSTASHPTNGIFTHDSMLGGAIMAPTAISSAVGQLTEKQVEISHQLLEQVPEKLKTAARQTYGAQIILCSLLFEDNPDRLKEEPIATLITAQLGHSSVHKIRRCAQWLQQKGHHFRLVLLDLALPTLAELGTAQQSRLLDLTNSILAHTQPLSAFNYVLRRLLKHTLQPTKSHNRNLEITHLDSDIRNLLLLISFAGHEDHATAQQAFYAAAEVAPTMHELSIADDSKPPSLDRIDEAFDHLSNAKPLFRKKILEAVITAIQFDGKVTYAEAELLRVCAQALDCPLPIGLRYAKEPLSAT